MYEKLVGNTPLLKINYRYFGSLQAIYCKAEYYNFTGSIKDRIALYILAKAKADNTLKENMPIIEATSGNTGISFAAFGRLYNHPCIVFMPDWLSKERITLMASFGVEVHLVSKNEGGFVRCIELADELAEKIGGFRPQQFNNNDNVQCHYLTTGEEIVEQMKSISKKVSGFVAGVGTGGTVMGIGKRLVQEYPNCLVCPIEPASSPTLKVGHQVGEHRIQGISDEFVPSIVKLQQLDEIIDVDDGDAIIMAQRLACELGIGVGISSGANFIGAVILQNKLGGQAPVVTVFSDDNKKYLSTDLGKVLINKDTFVNQNIQLVNIEVIA